MIYLCFVSYAHPMLCMLWYQWINDMQQSLLSFIIEQFNPLIKRKKNVLQNSMGMRVSGIHKVSAEIYVHILQMAMITVFWLFFRICSDNTRVKGDKTGPKVLVEWQETG